MIIMIIIIMIIIIIIITIIIIMITNKDGWGKSETITQSDSCASFRDKSGSEIF